MDSSTPGGLAAEKKASQESGVCVCVCVCVCVSVWDRSQVCVGAFPLQELRCTSLVAPTFTGTAS